MMEDAKARSGVRVAPITLVGDTGFYGTFPAQKIGLIVARGQRAEDLHADAFFTPEEASARR